MRLLITLTSDFGIQSQSVGVMEAVALSIAPNANVVHLMHGLPAYNIIAASRTLECVHTIQQGIHVCVCDPGVGTTRKAIICCTKRGDYLIGPDNGVLISATRLLGGITAVYEITNKKFMNLPVSPVFHGRDIFVPAAAHLALGISPQEFGPKLNPMELIKSPYEEATLFGNEIIAVIIQVNKFGSVHLNILHSLWDSLEIYNGQPIQLKLPDGKVVNLVAGQVFNDVRPGKSGVSGKLCKFSFPPAPLMEAVLQK